MANKTLIRTFTAHSFIVLRSCLSGVVVTFTMLLPQLFEGKGGGGGVY
jgi:hypothetical protein